MNLRSLGESDMCHQIRSKGSRRPPGPHLASLSPFFSSNIYLFFFLFLLPSSPYASRLPFAQLNSYGHLPLSWVNQ